MRLNSLASRLFVTSAAWTLVVLPVAGFLIDQRYFEEKRADFDSKLATLIEQINIDSFGGDTSVPQTPANRYEPLFEVTHSGWYWQIRPLDGAPGPRLVSPSLATGGLTALDETSVATAAIGNRFMNAVGPVGEPVRVVALTNTLLRDPARTRYSLIVAGPYDWITDPVGKFRVWLTMALALAGLGLVSVTWAQIAYGLSPLSRIERGLAAIRSGGAARLEGTLPAEIEPLQTELNALIQAHEDIVDRARTHVGNLAHALKTPLAVIANEAARETTPFCRKVAEQTEIMRDQINHHLDRARIAARAGVIGRVTLVRETAEPLVRALERIHVDKGVRIEVACPPDARFQGEKHDLEEMLGNLLDNACKWSRGRVYLTAAVRSGSAAAPRGLLIEIEDDGEGLTERQRARLGKRGVRLDETKPGSGLGLSIVKDLARSYQGTFELAPSRHGGLLARLDLPSA